MDNKHSQRGPKTAAVKKRQPLARTKGQEIFSEQARSEELSYLQEQEHNTEDEHFAQAFHAKHKGRCTSQKSSQRVLPAIQSKKSLAARPETRRGSEAIRFRSLQPEQSVSKLKQPTRIKNLQIKEQSSPDEDHVESLNHKLQARLSIHEDRIPPLQRYSIRRRHSA